MRRSILGILLVVLGVVTTAPAGAQGAAEARGEVVDQDGNPVLDAVVTFTPVGNPSTSYSGKTNKKGKFFIAGLFAPSGDRWRMTLEAPDHVAAKIVVESRTVNRILLGDVYEKVLQPEEALPEIAIRPMGTVKVDFTVLPREMVETQKAEAAAALAKAQEEAAAAARAEAARKDPWEAGLQAAANGNLDEAVTLLQKAVQKQPDDAERVETLAKVMYQQGRHGEAETAALHAVELDSQRIGPRMVLYGIYVSTGRLEEARRVLGEARAIDPDNMEVLEQLAFVASESGNAADAISAHEAIVAVAPDNKTSWLALGDLYASEGLLEKSEQAYNKVIELDPANAHQIFYNLGALMINKADRSESDTQQAISAFRKALELEPKYAQAHKQLAFALLGVGDRAGAKGSLEAYVRLAPDAPDAAQMQAMISSLSK